MGIYHLPTIHLFPVKFKKTPKTLNFCHQNARFLGLTIKNEDIKFTEWMSEWISVYAQPHEQSVSTALTVSHGLGQRSSYVINNAGFWLAAPHDTGPNVLYDWSI